MNDEFKVMHFILINLLHYFPNGKYFFFLKKLSCEKYGSTWPDLKPDWSDQFLTHLKWPILNRTHLTCNWIDPNYPKSCLNSCIIFVEAKNPYIKKKKKIVIILEKEINKTIYLIHKNIHTQLGWAYPLSKNHNFHNNSINNMKFKKFPWNFYHKWK